MHSSGIAAPPAFHSGPSAAVILVVWAVLVGLAAIYALQLAVRDRDALPVAACIGALACAFNEPIYDLLGKLVYSQTPSKYVAFSAFGRHIPLAVVLGYLPWVGLVPYILSRMMAAGVSRARLHAIALGLTASVAAVEAVNALWLHSWRYYAPESGRGVLAGGIIQMASMPILCAFLLHVFADRFTGVRRALLGIVIPTMALPMTFAATSWPLYVTNYANVSQGVRWIGAALTIVFCVGAVLAVAYMAEQWHGRQSVRQHAAVKANGRSDADSHVPAHLAPANGSTVASGAIAEGPTV
jgi:hypothetical protein